jgi:hypothetical protein
MPISSFLFIWTFKNESRIATMLNFDGVVVYARYRQNTPAESK